ncbi:BON domain-containing protein [Flexithrix dorotheae]|uniref:BON domain-containing protein n=1 Tax=Flexithrix dorotheae TaxID=70993 RepID=UPI00039CEA1C|nr:BON domain-containing protein [Flexithrix dorotheae]
MEPEDTLKNTFNHIIQFIREHPQIFILLVSLCFAFSSVAQQREMDDEQIVLVLESQFAKSQGIPENNIDIISEDGIVSLSGHVNNLLVKREAREVTMSIRGVVGVIDRMEVKNKVVADDKIKENIKSAISKNPATKNYKVNISVNDGVVTLGGKVDSWQEKELTEMLAEKVIGVRSIENNLIFTATADRSDFDLKQDIWYNLKWDRRIDENLIEIKVNDGVVFISGKVGSAWEKNWVGLKSWINGVEKVDVSGLKVREKYSQDEIREEVITIVPDTEIRKAVENVFQIDPRVKREKIKITVKNGEVLLSGKVNSLQAKNAAADDANNIVGVWKVNNLLKVQPSIIPDNKQLVSDVEWVLNQNPYLEDIEVHVFAENGKITLQGAVDAQFEVDLAEELAMDVDGVLSVQNNLIVDSNLMPKDFTYHNYYRSYMPGPYQVLGINDKEIKDDIEEQIWWSPFINPENIKVEVNEGRALLTGKVNSSQEKQYATINALEAGALAVDNRLKVSKN